jgi:nitrite reductase/ring-hydroxylating ferredoxin subunit
MPRFVEVAKKSQIPANGVIGVEAEGKILALANLGGEIYALDDSCPHEAGPLSEGQLDVEEIVCPWHASHFDVRTVPRHDGPGHGRRCHLQGAPRRRRGEVEL